MGRRALTLIELLVVIGIIAMLAGMLMPAVNAARSEAWTTSCKNRLHQIGYAVEMFTHDHGDCLPDFVYDDDVWSSGGQYFFGFYPGDLAEPVDFSRGFLSPYVSNDTEIWQCPEFTEFFPLAEGPTCGYAYNYYYLTQTHPSVVGLPWWDPGYKDWKVGRETGVIRKTTTTALFGDSAKVNTWSPLSRGYVVENWHWTPFKEIDEMAAEWGFEPLYEPYTHFRHRGQANVVWADNHVDSRKPHPFAPLDKHSLGYLCGPDDVYFDPEK